MTAARRALDAWNALDSKDGIGAALHLGQMLADALTAEVRPYGTVTEAEVEDVPGFEGTRDAVDGLSVRGGESS